MAVNKDRIRKWVEALRSGNYKQGHNVLQTQTGYYCCLGVACEVFLEETGKGVWSRSSDQFQSGFGFHVESDEVSSSSYSQDTLPRAVSAWFGFSNDNPILKESADGITKEHATHLNDTLNYSFNEIAKVIEEKYLGPCEAS